MIKIRISNGPNLKCRVCKATNKNKSKKFYAIILRGSFDDKLILNSNKYRIMVCTECRDLLINELIKSRVSYELKQDILHYDRLTKNELINTIEEEYIKGAGNIINFLREEGIICKTEDNCNECLKVDEFFKKIKGNNHHGL